MPDQTRSSSSEIASSKQNWLCSLPALVPLDPLDSSGSHYSNELSTLQCYSRGTKYRVSPDCSGQVTTSIDHYTILFATVEGSDSQVNTPNVILELIVSSLWRTENSNAHPLLDWIDDNLATKAEFAFSFLGLSYEDLANIFDVSIQEIFDWIGNCGWISFKNRERVCDLFVLVAETLGESRTPFYRKYMIEPLDTEQSSILELLTEHTWNIPQLKSLLKRVHELTEAWESGQESEPDEWTLEEYEDNLTYNLLSHGIEG